jgi:hypothetical protein
MYTVQRCIVASQLQEWWYMKIYFTTCSQLHIRFCSNSLFKQQKLFLMYLLKYCSLQCVSFICVMPVIWYGIKNPQSRLVYGDLKVHVRLFFFFFCAVDFQCWRKQQKVKLYFSTVTETRPVLVSTEYRCPHSNKDLCCWHRKGTLLHRHIAPTRTPSGTLLAANIPWSELSSKNSTLFWRNVISYKNWFYRKCVWMTITSPWWGMRD